MFVVILSEAKDLHRREAAGSSELQKCRIPAASDRAVPLPLAVSGFFEVRIRQFPLSSLFLLQSPTYAPTHLPRYLQDPQLRVPTHVLQRQVDAMGARIYRDRVRTRRVVLADRPSRVWRSSCLV